MVQSNKSIFYSFTLIEILVIVSIIAIMSGLVIAGYSNFGQESQLNRDVQKLTDVLSLAKGKAQTGEISFDCPAGEEFGGYRVEIDTDNYVIKQCCQSSNDKIITSCGADVVPGGSNLHRYEFAQNVVNSTGNTIVDFYPLSRGASSVTITLSTNNLTFNKSLDVSITNTGLITKGELY